MKNNEYLKTKASPVIKWAGGKRQLIPQIKEMLPNTYNRYYEPFFGGGALFCELAPKSATINDFNKQLIGMYKQIKADPNDVCAELLNLQTQYNKKITMEEKDALYYEIREKYNSYLKGNDEMKRSSIAALLKDSEKSFE